AYSSYGYFPEHELAAIAAEVLRARVTEPRRLLQRFVAAAEGGSDPAVQPSGKPRA
ncbi:MAG: hypothetical protein QOC59_1005, partial [Microbacteriaceae bacterium]|nr:hypothetical protein [Microbacteriaceae bacterium]